MLGIVFCFGTFRPAYCLPLCNVIAALCEAEILNARLKSNRRQERTGAGYLHIVGSLRFGRPENAKGWKGSKTSVEQQQGPRKEKSGASACL